MSRNKSRHSFGAQPKSDSTPPAKPEEPAVESKHKEPEDPKRETSEPKAPEPEAPAKSTEPAPVEKAAPAPATAKPRYAVAKGKAIVSRIGVLADGQEVRVKDIYGGEETIRRLVSKGHVVENKG